MSQEIVIVVDPKDAIIMPKHIPIPIKKGILSREVYDINNVAEIITGMGVSTVIVLNSLAAGTEIDAAGKKTINWLKVATAFASIVSSNSDYRGALINAVDGVGKIPSELGDISISEIMSLVKHTTATVEHTISQLK